MLRASEVNWERGWQSGVKQWIEGFAGGHLGCEVRDDGWHIIHVVFWRRTDPNDPTSKKYYGYISIGAAGIKRTVEEGLHEIASEILDRLWDRATWFTDAEAAMRFVANITKGAHLPKVRKWKVEVIAALRRDLHGYQRKALPGAQTEFYNTAQKALNVERNNLLYMKSILLPKNTFFKYGQYTEIKYKEECGDE